MRTAADQGERKRCVWKGRSRVGERDRRARKKEEAPLRQREEEDIRIRQRRGWEWPADAVSGGGGGGGRALLLLVDACERRFVHCISFEGRGAFVVDGRHKPFSQTG